MQKKSAKGTITVFYIELKKANEIQEKPPVRTLAV